LLFQSKNSKLHTSQKSKRPRNSLGGKPKPNPANRYKLPSVAHSDQLFDLEFGKFLKNNCEQIPPKDPKVIAMGAKPHRMLQTIHDDLKKGDIFYVDTTHLDHIEVYTAQGNARSVLNLDGSLNIIKSNIARSQNRKIIV
jgi:hypothetical protein